MKGHAFYMINLVLQNNIFSILFISEMRPCWFQVDKIPYSEMWPDDKHWFPLFLQGSKFSGYFKFEGHDNIIDYKLEKVEQIPNS